MLLYRSDHELHKSTFDRSWVEQYDKAIELGGLLFSKDEALEYFTSTVLIDHEDGYVAVGRLFDRYWFKIKSTGGVEEVT